MENKVIGDFGEKIAKEYLLASGYEILEQNFTCRLGEIDIIAQKGDQLVFGEVKTRTSDVYGLPREAVGKNKISHIKKTAALYLLSNNINNKEIRYDVFEVYCNQIEGAF
ncbi:MAG: YraN family protein [Anaerovoracaceae bacterium]